MSLAIGIDLGTTNTVVAAVVDGVAVTLQDEQGRRLLPSVVSFHPSGTVLVGEAARERQLVDPENTIFSVKTLLGRTFDAPEVDRARKLFPFVLKEGSKNGVAVLARGTEYALPEISAFVLKRAKTLAEQALRQPVTRAVITVPANFNELQRASTKIAGKLAGLEVLRIINEPTAAALAYGQSLKGEEKVAVYDLGGGTFDITLLDLAGSVFEVLSTKGDTALGGDDVDRVLADALATDVQMRFGFDPRGNTAAMGRLRFLAEEIKKELSLQPESFRNLEGVGQLPNGAPIQMPLRVARPDLERLAKPLVDRTITVVRGALVAAGLTPKDFARVIMVGGSTRMPLVVRAVQDFFGRPPHLDVNPDEVVALGAAIQANTLAPAKKPPPIKAPPPVPPGPMRPRAATAPGIGAPLGANDDVPAFLEFSRPAPTLSFSVPPPKITEAASMDLLFGIETREGSASRPIDEAFARGSAVRTAASPPLLIDVTPHSLRVETVGGYCDVLIHANSPVPCEKARIFLTATDNQTVVTVRVAQGESSRFSENTYLGELELSGLTPGPRGTVKIGVIFELDADGTLDVRARDESSGRETKAQMRLLATPNDIDLLGGVLSS